MAKIEASILSADFARLGEQARDTERIAALARPLDAGDAEQVWLSQDVFAKTRIRRYGGWGCDHILTNLVPMFRRAGITQAQMTTMMVHNPARLLTVPERNKAGKR
jgi:phosphotriesterase-related protein